MSLKEECDLKLISSVSDVTDIPKAGKSLVIVAAVKNVLHFRIFDWLILRFGGLFQNA